MKRIIALIISICMLILPFAGCAAGNVTDNSGKIKIVATIFPQYDWLKNLTEGVDGVKLTLLLDNGADLHNYQPTAADMITVSTCDMFVYVGGESDSWVEDALKEAVNTDMQSVSLMDILGESVREEEIVEGMQAEEEESGEPEYDEHVWLSLRNIPKICESLTDTLCQIDSPHSDIYKSNCESYVKELEELDGKYVSLMESSKYDTLLFGDRFPFRYLADNYNLKYYAAFVGCSAETEASFETVRFLSEKLREFDLPAVLTLEKSDGKIAKTIVETSGRTDVEILKIDSMQSVSSDDINAGTTYISIMEKNLDVLSKALN